MPKRTLFTNITPLPAEVTREVAVAMLHDHDEMIELNPLVIEHHPIKTPRDAPADEFLDCVWQELTDRIHYLPGGVVKGKVSYKACFHDLPLGLQTHIYAPLGLDIREKWSIGGTVPGEAPEARELGLDVPSQGLYIREDADMRCSRFLTSFVRKNLDHAHKVLVERILKKAQRIERHRETMSHHSYQVDQPSVMRTKSTGEFQSGSHMANSRIIHSPLLNQHPSSPPQSPTYLQPPGPSLNDHPAFRDSQSRTWSVQSGTSTLYNPQQSINAYPAPSPSAPPSKQFVAELEGSYYHPRSSNSPSLNNRQSVATELSGQSNPTSHASLTPRHGQSDRGSISTASNQPPTPPSKPQQYQHQSQPLQPQQNGYRYNPNDFELGQGQAPLPSGGYQRYQDDMVKSKNKRASELPAVGIENHIEQMQRMR